MQASSSRSPAPPAALKRSRRRRSRRSTLAPLSFSVLLASLSIAPRVGAQSSSIQCLANSRFLFNSRGQSPCDIGVSLGAVCNNGQFVIEPLNDGQVYVGPIDPDECSCSTVLYSMISACAVCQGATRITTWRNWSRNCTEVFIQEYPRPIPEDTAVPGWAFADVVTTNAFNPLNAVNFTGPESTAVLSQTTTSTIETTTSLIQTQTLSTSSGGNGITTGTGPMTTITPDQGNNGTEDGGDGDNDENDESNNSNTGLLAGAIVGGVVGVAGLVLLIAWVISRKRRRNLESGMDTVQHRPFVYGRGESVGGFVGGVPPGSIGGGTKFVGTGVNTNSNGYSGYGDNVREWNRGADATNSAFNMHTGYASSAASTHTRATNASLLPNELRQRSPTIQGLDRTSQNLWTTASPPSSGTGAPMVAPAGVNVTSPVARSSPPAIRMIPPTVPTSPRAESPPLTSVSYLSGTPSYPVPTSSPLSQNYDTTTYPYSNGALAQSQESGRLHTYAADRV